jgi:hypothetical protein
MRSFLRTRTFFVVISVVAALLAIESLLTHDWVQGVLFLVAAGAFGWRVAAWNRGRPTGD